MTELSFLTIIVSLAVCSILVFAVYQYMKVRFTILEHSQKEQALILQQYIEESSYDIQGLQSVVFRQAQNQNQHQPQTGGGFDAVSEMEEEFHNKHIHLDTVMYDAPNKQRSTLIAISSDSEDTTSDGSESDGSESDGSESDGSESDGSDGSESDGSDGSESDGSDIEQIHDIHEVKHIEISMPATTDITELEIESIEPSLETPAPEYSSNVAEPTLDIDTTDIKTITVDLGANIDTSSVSDSIDVMSLLNKKAQQLSHEEHDADLTTHHHLGSIATSAASASFQGLSVIELRALLKEKFKGQHDKITNLQKLKKPELVQLLQE